MSLFLYSFLTELSLLSFRALLFFLLALMSVLSQSLLTLVSGHLVSLMLLSVWHNCVVL